MLRQMANAPFYHGAVVDSQVLRIPADMHEISMTALMTQDQSRQPHYEVLVVGELSYDNAETWQPAIGTANLPAKMNLAATRPAAELFAPHALGQSIGSFDGIYGAFDLVFDDPDGWTSFGATVFRQGQKATHFRARLGLRLTAGTPQYARLGIAVWGTKSNGDYITSIVDGLVSG